MRIWYTKEVETDPAGMVRTDFGNTICDLHMGYQWFLSRGHLPINHDNIFDTHDFVFGRELPTDDLEAVFEMFQGEFMDVEIRQLLRDRGASHTSMSVGDIIETADGKLHFVDGLGFVTLGSK